MSASEAAKDFEAFWTNIFSPRFRVSKDQKSGEFVYDLVIRTSSGQATPRTYRTSEWLLSLLVPDFESIIDKKQYSIERSDGTFHHKVIFTAKLNDSKTIFVFERLHWTPFVALTPELELQQFREFKQTRVNLINNSYKFWDALTDTAVERFATIQDCNQAGSYLRVFWTTRSNQSMFTEYTIYEFPETYENEDGEVVNVLSEFTKEQLGEFHFIYTRIHQEVEQTTVPETVPIQVLPAAPLAASANAKKENPPKATYSYDKNSKRSF